MGSRIWVTADTHFGESAAIARFGRAHGDVREMDEALLEAINRRVRPRDVLLHLGDVFGDLDWGDREVRRGARTFLERIRCRTVVLVRGNQDPASRRFAKCFAESHDMLDLRVDDPHEPGRRLRVVCCHYPLRQWRGTWSGAMHLHGHSHGSLPEHGRSTDVGVDCWSYAPVPLDDLVALLARRPAPQGEFRRMQPMRSGEAQPPL